MKLINLFLILFASFAGSDIERENFEGYGESSVNEVQDLNKALEAQEGVTDIADLEDGGALQVQSLESQLAMLTFQQKHLKFFNDIGVTKAYSTLEEYSVQNGYGTEGGFVGQMENPEEGDPDFLRNFAIMKFIRTLWKTADVLTYTKTISDADIKSVQAAMMRALRITERSLFFGDSEMVPTAFDGIKKTIIDEGTTQHVIDLRGSALSESVMKEAAELISTNYGVPTDMYISNSVQTGLDNLLQTGGAQRYNQEVISTGSGLVSLGHSVKGMKTGFGDFNFKPDIFINPESQGVPTIKNPSNKKLIIEGATSAKAPAMPTFALVVNAPTVAGSLWSATAGDSGGAIAGAYKYRVCAINAYGKSQAAAEAAATVAANGAITVNITPGAGTYPATAYEIYREDSPASGNFYLLTTVTAAAATYQDKNEELSGTSQAFLVDNTTVGEDRTMSLSQLAPMHKVNYAKIAPYKWGTVNFYIVPKWYAPLRYVMFKNIGVGRKVRSPLLDL